MTLLHPARTSQKPDTGALLDCSSQSAATLSLSSGLQIPAEVLRNILCDIPPRKLHSRKSLQFAPPDEALWSELCSRYPVRPWSQGTVWFHASRSWNVEGYQRGLLPLREVLPEIWQVLERCARPHLSQAQWEKFRVTLGHHRHRWLFEQKVHDARQWGPHGMLLREAAFQPAAFGNLDFLHAPETVLDLCQCFRGFTGLDLLHLYQHHTRPCMVHFWTPGTSKNSWVKALYWVYGHVHHLEPSTLNNHFFDGRGTGVPARQLLKIEVFTP